MSEENPEVPPPEEVVAPTDAPDTTEPTEQTEQIEQKEQTEENPEPEQNVEGRETATENVENTELAEAQNDTENPPDKPAADNAAAEEKTEQAEAPEEPAPEAPAEDAPAAEEAPAAEASAGDAPAEEAGQSQEAGAPAEEQAPTEEAIKVETSEQKKTEETVEPQEEPKLEEKKTPEPPTEAMGTSTEKVETPREQAPPTSSQQPSSQNREAKYDENATATVKFVLMPTQQVATLRCHLSENLADLKQHFAEELKMPTNYILLMFDGKNADDSATLGDLGVGPNGTIQLEMQSADPVNAPIKAFKPRQEYHMPDVITVRVQSEEGYRDVVVEIERTTNKKPFLGGYRHKKTNVEYHHASAQTMQKPRQQSNIERYCRDTQTTQQKHMVQQTTNDMSTQMNKVGVYVSNMEDKLVIPGKYTTADDFHSNILNRVVIIQKYYRRWLAKKYVVKVRDDKQQRLEWERQEELRKKKEKEDRIKREFERRMNPKSKEDFDLLYHALEKWRQEELDRINSELTGAERKAALCQLLDQETQLIASVGRHQNEANGENKQKAIQKFLEKAAAPKKWKGSDGKTTEMDTPYTIRAQELRDIYNSINMKYLTQDERLDVLLTLKHTVKEHDCKLTQEIIELIDREADLLMRGVRESNLDGLRKRISTLFLQYIKTPTFNPEAARLLKVPQDPSTLRKNIYFCSSCNQYLPSTEFQLSSNSKAAGKCRKCNNIDNDARVRQDYSHYRYMLKGLRRQEEVYSDGSKIAFLMQENDLRYLVENVWNSQSVLSAWDDLYDLTLVRWDKHTEWSPWNCILLTKEEASAHDKLENLDEAYGKVFIHKVQHKHTLARNYFSRLPGMAEHIRGSSSARSNAPSVSGKGLVPARA